MMLFGNLRGLLLGKKKSYTGFGIKLPKATAYYCETESFEKSKMRAHAIN